MGCSIKKIPLAYNNLNLINREVITSNNATNTLVLNNKIGDGIAILKNLEFDEGIIKLE